MQQGDRLKELRKLRRLTQTQAAEILNLNQQSWALLEKGKRKLKSEEAQLLANSLNVSLDWIISGLGNVDDSNTSKGIKIVNIAALAGLSAGFQPPQMEVVGTLTIPGIKEPHKHLATSVSGRSMEPYIQDGSHIIIQKMTQRAEFKDGKVYVVVINSVPFVKRVNMIISGTDNGKFKISSDNEDANYILTGDEIEHWYKVTHVINPI